MKAWNSAPHSRVLPSLREQVSPSFRALLKAQLAGSAGTGRGVSIHNFKV